MTTLAKAKSPDLSVGRPGHWRNKFWSADGWAACSAEAIHVDANTCVLSDRYSSEAEAEQAGHEDVQMASDPNDRWYDPLSTLIYLGAVFFPAEGAL